jgi:hypothetical protein
MTPNMIKNRFMELTVRIKALEDKIAKLEKGEVKTTRTKKATKEE